MLFLICTSAGCRRQTLWAWSASSISAGSSLRLQWPHCWLPGSSPELQRRFNGGVSLQAVALAAAGFAFARVCRRVRQPGLSLVWWTRTLCETILTSDDLSMGSYLESLAGVRMASDWAIYTSLKPERLDDESSVVEYGRSTWPPGDGDWYDIVARAKLTTNAPCSSRSQSPISGGLKVQTASRRSSTAGQLKSGCGQVEHDRSERLDVAAGPRRPWADRQVSMQASHSGRLGLVATTVLFVPFCPRHCCWRR